MQYHILDSALVKENIDPSGSYGEFGDYGKAWLTTNDAGSGPYKIKEMRTEEYVLMEQSDNYWREIDENAPKEAKLLGGVVTSTMKTMVSRGELDVTDTAQTPETLDSMVEKGGASLVRVLNGGNFNISLNTQLAPTDDVHFRRAMAYALDYDAVNNDTATRRVWSAAGSSTRSANGCSPCSPTASCRATADFWSRDCGCNY